MISYKTFSFEQSYLYNILHLRIEVSLSQVQSLENFDIHHIKLEDRHTGDTHRVIHLNFTTWPDHGTPGSGVPLLQVSTICGNMCVICV